MVAVIEGLEAVTIHVRDIERSRKFYSTVLGLKEVGFIAAASRAAFALPGTAVQLTMHPMGPEEGGREPGTVSGIVFAHQNPVTACAEIARRGGAIVDEPRTYTNPLGKVTLGVFADPDGNQFVLRHIELVSG